MNNFFEYGYRNKDLMKNKSLLFRYHYSIAIIYINIFCWNYNNYIIKLLNLYNFFYSKNIIVKITYIDFKIIRIVNFHLWTKRYV